MKKLSLLIIALAPLLNLIAQSTTNSNSTYIKIYPDADRIVNFNLSDAGIAKPIIWGLDLAWLDLGNIKRGVAYMGKENVDLIRSSFMPTDPLSNGALTGSALTNTKLRINYINSYLDAHTKIVLNCDHPSVNSFFYGNATNWSDLIQITAEMHQNAGREIITVSPFNEPDNSSTGQGTINHFYAIAEELQSRDFFNNIRVSGGNTLNNDEALNWYNTLESQLDEGNTHQLAGSFNNYAAFYETVRANGHHATNDELHNTMEAIVGVQYGLQTGIWWGTAEHSRGEFVKASDGVRLGYAEHRPNWTAAAVYKRPTGEVRGFVGSSERQAVATTYKFVSEDRDVYYDGHGPQREYIVEIPGGTGYQQGQTNAETVVNITWGEDIQPVIDGKYFLINRNSGKILEPANGATGNGANIQQNTYNGANHQQWLVKPINPRNGGDFSYFTIKGATSGKHLDVTNASFNNGANVIQWEKGTWWDGSQSLNQVWYLEYNEDGWFYIRNRFSNKCLEVSNAITGDGANIQQWELDGGKNQQWRFVPVGVTPQISTPGIPSGLLASAYSQSIALSWDANTETDLEGYTICRSAEPEGPYNTIARNITGTKFVDNTVETGQTYHYKIKASDKALNSSVFTRTVSASSNGTESLTVEYNFEENTSDESVNLNHCVGSSTISYVEGKTDSSAIAFNGEDAFLQLPATIANKDEITIAFWINWQRAIIGLNVFNFSKNEDEYIYFTPVNKATKMEFAIKNKTDKIILNAPFLPFKTWTHIAITLSDSEIIMYQNGEKVATYSGAPISPNSIKPIFNYIGRGSNNSSPYFKGYVDDFRIYNYAVSENKVAQLAGLVNTNDFKLNEEVLMWPNPASNKLNISLDDYQATFDSQISIFDLNGSLIKNISISEQNTNINLNDIPAGIYFIKFANSHITTTRKLIVKH